jgi:hypothetical protein
VQFPPPTRRELHKAGTVPAANKAGTGWQPCIALSRLGCAMQWQPTDDISKLGAKKALEEADPTSVKHAVRIHVHRRRPKRVACAQDVSCTQDTALGLSAFLPPPSPASLREKMAMLCARSSAAVAKPCAPRRSSLVVSRPAQLGCRPQRGESRRFFHDHKGNKS